MNKILVFIFSLAYFLYPELSQGQVPNLLSPAKATSAELAKRGITEQELVDKLAEKGIYLDDLENMTVDEAIRFQALIEQALSELEAEKSGLINDEFKANDTTVRPPNIKNRIKLPVAKDDIDTDEPQVQVAPGIPQGSVEDTIKYLPAVKTSRTSNTQSNLKAQPVNIGDLVYGQELFRNKSIQLYNKSENIKPPESYILSVGDIVNIHVFGRSKADHKNLEINKQGYIQVGGFPRIYIKGLTFGQAKQVVSQQMSNYYIFAPNEFEMTIDYSREIGVNIYGEAEQIGTFNMPATNTAINALVAARGPNKIGSVRNIKLIRGGKVRLIDVYEFIENPAIAQDYYLEQNDVIHIPVAEKVVAINGAVRRPMKYELLPKENLMKLIAYSAGLREDAYLRSIQVKRFINDREEIIDVPLKELMDKKSDFNLISGDVVTVKNIPIPLEEVVSIEGRVETPGTYQFTKGMKVSDLLEKGQVRRGARTDIAFMMRMNDDETYAMSRINVKKILEDPNGPENIELRMQDKLLIYSLSTYIDQAGITATGALRQGVNTSFDYNRTYRASDIIVMGGGLTQDALDIAYIKRVNTDNFVERQYILFNARKAMSDPGGADDPILEPNDQLLFYNDRTFFDETTVTISGEVRTPGTFSYGPGFTLKDAIVLSGGFTMQAATNRIEIFRILLDENRPTKTTVATLTLNRGSVTLDNQEGSFELKPFDQIYVRTVPEFEMHQNVQIEGEVKFPGTYAIIKDNETVVDLLRRAGGPTGESFLEGATLQRTQDGIGYIVFEMKEALKNPTGYDNLILKKGDILSVPKVIDYVRVEGATDAVELYQDKLIGSNNSINVVFVPNKSAKFYVDEFAAGVSKDGAKGRITVERPNGRILKTKSFLIFKKYPKVEKGSVVRVGDKPAPTEKGLARRAEVVVDEKGVKRTVTRKKVDWERLMSDTIAKSTAVLSFVLLVRTALNTGTN